MAKVESKLGAVERGVYRNKKTGKEYIVLGFLVSSTNGHLNGEVLVRYRRPEGTCEFARWEPEFVEKFTFLGRLKK